jgi:hypothetical protein
VLALDGSESTCNVCLYFLHCVGVVEQAHHRLDERPALTEGLVRVFDLALQQPVQLFAHLHQQRLDLRLARELYPPAAARNNNNPSHNGGVLVNVAFERPRSSGKHQCYYRFLRRHQNRFTTPASDTPSPAARGNRNARVWHGATENGPGTMDKPQTPTSHA